MSGDTETESFRVEGERYCISNEMLDLGNKKGISQYNPCTSSDALSVYQNEDSEGNVSYTAYCYSCHQHFNKENFGASSHAKDFGIEGGVVTDKIIFNKPPKRLPITVDERRLILSYGYEGKGYRELKDKYNQYFGHVTKLDVNGVPRVRFYPETVEGKLVGYKSRTFEGKRFGYENAGQTGINSDLSGQVKFKDAHFRDILIVGGEEDVVAAFQIWQENKKKYSKNTDENYAPMPVVSPTTGESSALKQIRNQYDFINRAENIYLGLDNDDVGRAAAAEIAAIFPAQKVHIIYWTKKDPNGFIYNAEKVDYSAQFVRDFYNAKPFINMGILTSTEADSLIEDELLRPKMSLPPFMKDLQNKMAGGIPLGYAVNWIAETGY